MVPVIFFLKKNDPFLTYEPPKVSIFLALVTGLVQTKLHAFRAHFLKVTEHAHGSFEVCEIAFIYI